MDRISDDMYAYPMRKMYPIDTLDNLVASHDAYNAYKQNIPNASRCSIEDAFNKAASYYGIELEEPVAPMDKRASVLLTAGNLGDLEVSVIQTEEEAEKAAEVIVNMRKQASRADLAEPARYVLWSASTIGADLNTDAMRKVAKIAGAGIGARDTIENELLSKAYDSNLSDKERDLLKKYASDVHQLSDDEFYSKDTLDKICNVLDGVDAIIYPYGNSGSATVKTASAEDIVFADTLDDMLDQVEDELTIQSINTRLSKRALLERTDSINEFFEDVYGYNPKLEGEDVIIKVASLDPTMLLSLIETIQ